VYERDSNDVCKKVSQVFIGRTSTDFVSAGVISSTLAVRNTSASDDIAGTQTHAVLYSHPKTIDSIGATDLLQFASQKDLHLVSNINSKEDHTITNAYTEHVGAQKALLRDAAISNRASTSFSVSASNSQAQGFIGNGVAASSPISKTTVTVGSSPTVANALFDSGRDSAFSPFTLESYSGHVSLNLALASGAVSQSAHDLVLTLTACLLDAAGKALAVQDFTYNPIAPGDTLAAEDIIDVMIDSTLVSTTVPAARICVFVKSYDQSATPIPVARAAQISSGTVEALSEIADISERGVHFCVLEGLNAAAAINVQAANILSGVPDSNNAFISSGSKSSLILNYAIITNMLVTFRTMMPLAYTGFGRDGVQETLARYYELEGMSVKMQAMNFADIGRALRSLERIGRTARKTGSQIADIADPALRYGGAALMTGILGPQGQGVGAGMLAGSAAIQKARQAGLLE